ncbi:hypothetical protein TX39_14165, partial [Listeria monocytogenes]|nr:hypothetical protein [Listeria monocytogenes]
ELYLKFVRNWVKYYTRILNYYQACKYVYFVNKLILLYRIELKLLRYSKKTLDKMIAHFV